MYIDAGRLATKSCLSPIALLRRVLNEQLQLQKQQNSKALHSNNGQGTLTNSQSAIHSDTAADDVINNNNQRQRRSINSPSSEAETISGDENNDIIASNITITPAMFMDLCPALLVQIEQGACAEVVRIEMGRLEKGFGVGNTYSTTSLTLKIYIEVYNIGLIICAF